MKSEREVFLTPAVPPARPPRQPGGSVGARGKRLACSCSRTRLAFRDVGSLRSHQYITADISVNILVHWSNWTMDVCWFEWAILNTKIWSCPTCNRFCFWSRVAVTCSVGHVKGPVFTVTLWAHWCWEAGLEQEINPTTPVQRYRFFAQNYACTVCI